MHRFISGSSLRLLATALLVVQVSTAAADDADVAAKVRLFDENASAFDKRVANDEWDQVVYTVKNMETTLAEIRTKDPKRDVSKLVKRLADARAKFEAHKQAEQKSTEQRKHLEALERAHKEALRMAGDLDSGRAPRSDRLISEAVTALGELEEVATTCKAQQLSGTSCTLAEKRAEIAKAVLARELAAEIPAAMKRIASATEALERDGTFVEESRAALDLDALRTKWTAKYEALAAIAGTPLDAAQFDPILDASKALVAKIPAAAKKSRLPTGAGTAPAQILADTKATFPKLKVLKVVVGKAWDVELNDFRVPVNRTAHGAALVQQPGEAHCRVVLFLATQPYERGRYGTAHVDRFDPAYLISACR